jgi:hypothetical protein
MPRQDRTFVDRRVRKESVGRLGVGPILAGQGNGLTERAIQLAHQLAQPFAEASIAKSSAIDFRVDP